MIAATKHVQALSYEQLTEQESIAALRSRHDHQLLTFWRLYKEGR